MRLCVVFLPHQEQRPTGANLERIIMIFDLRPEDATPLLRFRRMTKRGGLGYCCKNAQRMWLCVAFHPFWLSARLFLHIQPVHILLVAQDVVPGEAAGLRDDFQ